jgi:hypothetical protein
MKKGSIKGKENVAAYKNIKGKAKTGLAISREGAKSQTKASKFSNVSSTGASKKKTANTKQNRKSAIL